jgi:plastocyanin
MKLFKNVYVLIGAVTLLIIGVIAAFGYKSRIEQALEFGVSFEPSFGAPQEVSQLSEEPAAEAAPDAVTEAEDNLPLEPEPAPSPEREEQGPTTPKESPTPKEEPVPVLEKTVTVTYGDSGFNPAAVSIAAGDTVKFVNNSSRTVWPASDFHPEHNIYPVKGGCFGSAFDSCRGVAPGSSWSFTFTAKGAWAYHDHLRPSMTGRVVVE